MWVRFPLPQPINIKKSFTNLSLTNIKMYDIISYKIKMSLSSRRVRTLPFQGRNTGSSPVRLTNKLKDNEIEYICTTS